jgi:hypothetical protein
MTGTNCDLFTHKSSRSYLNHLVHYKTVTELRKTLLDFVSPVIFEWKKSITVPVYRQGDKTDCSNYRGISLLSTTYEILSNILLSRLTPYAEEITGDHQCGFRHNRSTTDHMFCIR